MGALPTHPELLDWLAAEFRDGGQSIATPGSIKSLQRLIVLSGVYRQSSATNAANERIDGGNQYLWRMNRDRLDAEAIRDTVLAGQRPARPDDGRPRLQQLRVSRTITRRTTNIRNMIPTIRQTHRRSIYRFIVRSVPDPLMETLDCADPSQLVPRRNETLTPLQALALMNNKFMVRMAEHFAERVGEDVAGRAGPDRRRHIGWPWAARRRLTESQDSGADLRKRMDWRMFAG